MKEWLVIQHPCLLQFPFMTGFSLHPSFSFIPSVQRYFIVSVWEAVVSSFTFFAVLAENRVTLKWEWNSNVKFGNILSYGLSQPCQLESVSTISFSLCEVVLFAKTVLFSVEFFQLFHYQIISRQFLFLNSTLSTFFSFFTILWRYSYYCSY